MLKNFEDKIMEIEKNFQTADEKIRTELRGTQEALQAARERAEGLQTRYRVSLAKNGDDAVRLKIELEVARDAVSLLEEMAAQLRQELEAGELQEAMMRRHAAICSAVEAEGNASISQAVQAAEAARDAYVEALDQMVRVQHKVADVGRRSVFTTSKTGRPCSPAQVLRYQASEFEVEAPSPSASAAPML